MSHLVTGVKDDAPAPKYTPLLLNNSNDAFYFSVVAHQLYPENHPSTALYFVFTL